MPTPPKMAGSSTSSRPTAPSVPKDSSLDLTAPGALIARHLGGPGGFVMPASGVSLGQLGARPPQPIGPLGLCHTPT